MKIFCFLGLICWLSFASAQNELMMIHALQEQALANSKHYADDVQRISQMHRPQEPIQEHLKKVGQVLVFLSFSMPEQSLKAWLNQCKQSGATPVIRGLINHSFKETIQKIQHLSQQTDMGLQLDPILFQAFGITQVPAVVTVNDYHYCPQQMSCKEVFFNKIYGDVTLDYALQKMRGGA